MAALAGPSCAPGQSLVTADLLAYPYPTVPTLLTILAPGNGRAD